MYANVEPINYTQYREINMIAYCKLLVNIWHNMLITTGNRSIISKVSHLHLILLNSATAGMKNSYLISLSLFICISQLSKNTTKSDVILLQHLSFVVCIVAIFTVFFFPAYVGEFLCFLLPPTVDHQSCVKQIVKMCIMWLHIYKNGQNSTG